MDAEMIEDVHIIAASVVVRFIRCEVIISTKKN